MLSVAVIFCNVGALVEEVVGIKIGAIFEKTKDLLSAINLGDKLWVGVDRAGNELERQAKRR